MKNGYKLQAYRIKLENNDFPSGQDKADFYKLKKYRHNWYDVSIF